MYQLALIISFLAAPAIAQELGRLPPPTTVGQRSCSSGDWCLTINFVSLDGAVGSSTFAAQDQEACQKTAAAITGKTKLPERFPRNYPHARDTGAACAQTP